jgi:hypothetical protein
VSAKPLLILGILNLIVAGALYYGIWWQVDPFLAVSMFLKTPIVTDVPEAELSAAVSQMLGMPIDVKPQTPPEPVAEPEAHRPRWSGSTTQKIIPGAAYAWLSLATIGCCAVALAGGATLGASAGPGNLKRVVGLFLLLFFIGGLAYGGFVMFTRYRTGYPVEYLRAGMGGLALGAAALGLALSPRGRGLRRVTRLASYALVVSATASAVGVYLWGQSGAMEPQYAAPAMLALIFAAHSAWGWLLLLLSFRM